MAGAAVAMAAEAALRCGAGLVKVATRPEHVAALVARAPEVMPLGGRVRGGTASRCWQARTCMVVGPRAWVSRPWAEYLLQAATVCQW